MRPHLFGKLKKIALRDVWQNEASDFTPWLAENVDELGKALGLELELVQREASVGDFSLDLLARDIGMARDVIIENQLNQTDHDHLGKLLTYAAGFDASIVIWVAQSIREEHRQALDWLNQRTDSETAFFGVVVEIIQIDDSSPAFNFRIAASPNEWQKSQKLQKQNSRVTTRAAKYQTYFQALIDELREVHSFTAARVGQPQNWYAFSAGTTGILYGANFAQGGFARTELYIDLGDQALNNSILTLLETERDKFQEKFIDIELNWEPLQEKRAARVAVYTEGKIDSSDEDLAKIREWHITTLLKFKEVFSDRISPLVKQAKVEFS